MKWLRVMGVCVVTACFAGAALASVSNPNPHGRIEIIGPEGATFRHAGESSDGFVVRLTDAQGNPLPGIKVEFFPDVELTTLPPPNSPPPPPAEMYGHFDTPFVLATTDANGIARSGRFTAGTIGGGYRVVAAVYISFYPENQAVFQEPPGPSARFQISQIWGGSPDALPALSLPGMLGLAGLLTALVWWKGRAIA
jgi:hypothetical protein